MRIYPKKLRGIEDLEREKQLLKIESRKLDSEELFSFEGIFDKKKTSSKKKEENEEASILDFIPISNPLVSMLLGFAERKMGDLGLKAGKNVFKTVAKEVIGGYLKWKAIELSIKGINHLVKTRKKTKSRSKA